MIHTNRMKYSVFRIEFDERSVCRSLSSFTNRLYIVSSFPVMSIENDYELKRKLGEE